MKQISKKMPLRKLIVNNEHFYVSAREGNCDDTFYLRCYAKSKTSYVEVRFEWNNESYPKVNPFRPVVASKIIEHFINSGWNYKKQNQIIMIQGKECLQLIKLLNLEIYN